MASASRAAARTTLLSLRRQIASIEGAPPAFADGDDAGWSAGKNVGPGLIATEFDDFDRALGGGIVPASLVELHARSARDAGTGTGFLVALLSLASAPGATACDPVLWIGGPGAFSEGGVPHGRGFVALGFDPRRLLIVEPKKLSDALWIAEEAARTRGLSATVLDMRGEPHGFGLRETLRLHRRAQARGRPVFLLRQSADADATAAPLRLAVAPAPSAPDIVLAATAHARAVPGGIGPPGFCVTIEKNKAGPAGRSFLMHWNSHERHFYAERAHPVLRRFRDASDAGPGGELVAFPAAGVRPAHSGAALSLSADGPDRARALGEGLAAKIGEVR